jgi:hypothetical protein
VPGDENLVMTSTAIASISPRPARYAAAPRHTDGLWRALAVAVQDSDDDPVDTRRRLAALRLNQAFASTSDFSRAAG